MATSEGSRVTVTGRLSRYTEAPKNRPMDLYAVPVVADTTRRPS